jgi:hypothetical protein
MLSTDTTVRLPMASRKSSCRTPDWNLERRERISVRAVFASSAHSCTRSPTKCVIGSLPFSTPCSPTRFTQWDERSTGPPPPPAILVTGLNPLTPYPQVRRHFAQYGTVVAFDGKSDKYTGAPLGIVWVNYSNHELAKHVAEKEDGQRVWLGGEGQVIKVELDSAQQEKCKQRVNAEIVRRKKEQDAKSMRPPPNPLLGSSSSSASSAPSATGAVPQVKRDASASTTATPLNASSAAAEVERREHFNTRERDPPSQTNCSLPVCCSQRLNAGRLRLAHVERSPSRPPPARILTPLALPLAFPLAISISLPLTSTCTFAHPVAAPPSVARRPPATTSTAHDSQTQDACGHRARARRGARGDSQSARGEREGAHQD